MNILLINHYAGSIRHGMAFRPYYLAKEWTRAGHKVTIAAASYSHIRSKQPEIAAPACDEVIDSVNYRWYRTPPYRGNGTTRVMNMLAFMQALNRDAKRLVADTKPDAVIASSTYPMDIWPARRIAKLSGARLVFEVHDLWPLAPMAVSGMPKWHPFIIWVQAAEDYAYRHADRVVSMLPNAKQHMLSRGMASEKLVHVPNGVDEKEWQGNPPELPSDVASAIAGAREDGLPVVGYAGTYGKANALDVLLDAALILRGRVRIIMAGTGPERDRLQARINTERLDHVTMLPALPKPVVRSLLYAIDIAYIGLHDNPLYSFGISPNKLMDYMMAAKPVVMAIRAGNDPVAESRCGLTVSPEDPAAVAEAILRLVSMPEESRLAMGRSGREAIIRGHTYCVLAERFFREALLS